MGKKEFDEFLRRQKEEEENKLSPDEILEIKNRYINYLNILYSNIKKWLSAYLKSLQIQIQDHTLEIEEEELGKYEVPELAIKVGRNFAWIIPVGTELIGTIGRVDLEGPEERVIFVLVNENAELGEREAKGDWVWKIISREYSKPSLTELSEDSFFDSLMKVLDGNHRKKAV